MAVEYLAVNRTSIVPIPGELVSIMEKESRKTIKAEDGKESQKMLSSRNNQPAPTHPHTYKERKKGSRKGCSWKERGVCEGEEEKRVTVQKFTIYCTNV